MFVTSFTHANTHREIMVSVPLIFSAYYSESHKCTHILSCGGAIIPVIETVEKVMASVSNYHENTKHKPEKTP